MPSKRQTLRVIISVCVMALAGLPSVAAGKSLEILADIRPVTLLVRAITQDVAKTSQLVEGGVSPHDFALRPSDIARLKQADLIIWTGPASVPALEKLLSKQAFAAKTLILSQVANTKCLPVRKPGLLADLQMPAYTSCDAQAIDGHLWLDPENAKTWALAIARRLAELDPGNAAEYLSNAEKLDREIGEAMAQAQEAFAQPGQHSFLQYHDAFQYFESYFELSPLGVATAGDDEEASLGLMAKLRAVLSLQSSACVFLDSPNSKDRARLLLEGSDTKVGVLDATGASVLGEDDTYVDLFRNLAGGFADCLYDQR